MNSVLVIASEYPSPQHKNGGTLYTHQFLKYFSKFYAITLLCYGNTEDNPSIDDEIINFCDVKIVPLPKKNGFISKLLSLFSLKPRNVTKFESDYFKVELDKIIKNHNIELIFSIGIGFENYILDIPIRKVIVPIDSLSLLFKRSYQHNRNLFKKIIFYWEHLRLLKYEKKYFPLFFKCIVVSSVDYQYLVSHGINNVIHSRNGVDTDYFNPEINVQKNYTLVFSGVMDYPPNIDAALYLVKEIMPILALKKFNCTAIITGRNPTENVKNLNSEFVKVTGHVKDIRPIIVSSYIYVAPLRYGTGIKNKILESAALGMPIIASSISLEGLEEFKDFVIKANSAEEFADAIIKLYNNFHLASNMGREARRLVINNYSWTSTFDKIKLQIN